jgi:hypothetical protein
VFFWIDWTYMVPPKGIPTEFWFLILGCTLAVIFFNFQKRLNIGST